MFALGLKVWSLLFLDDFKPFILLHNDILYLSFYILAHSIEKFHMSIWLFHLLNWIWYFYILLSFSFLQKISLESKFSCCMSSIIQIYEVLSTIEEVIITIDEEFNLLFLRFRVILKYRQVIIVNSLLWWTSFGKNFKV